MATQLELYNDALRLIGERKLSSLTEAREPRRVLDDAYTGAVKYCLEKGYWKFAARTTKLLYSPSVNPSFGYLKAYEKPTDCVKLVKICQDEFFGIPLLEYSEEGNFWYGHNDDVYVQYISNHITYGADLSLWTETFSRYVGLYLAVEVAPRLVPAADIGRLMGDRERALSDAQAKDAMQGPTMFMPSGLWGSARGGRGGHGGRRDRGNRGSLIG